MSGPVGDQPGPLVDEPHALPLASSRVVYEGRIWPVLRDEVVFAHGETAVREYVDHTGAVGIIALDDDERVLLIQQYRHPARHLLWEAPAGILDRPGEDALEAARRELREETGYRADQWNVLVDVYNSPGMSSECIRIFLARGLHHSGTGGFTPDGEEVGMPVVFRPLDQVVAQIMAGQLHNATLVSGALAALAARSNGYHNLRLADSPWPTRSPRSLA